MPTISYYEVADEYMDMIERWFHIVYGIKLYKKQILPFCISTVSIVTTKTRHSLEIAGLYSSGLRHIPVDKETSDIFQKKYKQYHKNNKQALFATMLIYQRALTLPPIKLIPHATKIENETADKDRFTQRFHLETIDTKQDQSENQ